MEQIISVATLIVGVAMVAVLVQSKNTAPVISATGNAFAGAIKASQGNLG